MIWILPDWKKISCVQNECQYKLASRAVTLRDKSIAENFFKSRRCFLVTHKQNKIRKMGDTGGRDARTCFFPLTINSDTTRQRSVTSPTSLASYFNEHWLFFFSRVVKKKHCWNAHWLEVKNTFNCLRICRRPKMPRTADITERRTVLYLLVSYQAGKAADMAQF